MSFPVGGRLALFKENWKFDSRAFSIVSKGLGWRWALPPPPPRRSFQQPTPFLVDYLPELLRGKVIKEVKTIRFLRAERRLEWKEGDSRLLCLELSILCDEFRMLSISQVWILLPRRVFTISIDLTDAYWHLSVS